MTIADEIQALSNDRTAIQNAILAKGGTVTSADGFDDFASAIAAIPSGGTTIINGEFTTQSTSGIQHINIPYSGNGYPIMLYLVTDKGILKTDPFKSSTAEDTIGEFVLIKSHPDLEPEWLNGLSVAARDECLATYIFKYGSPASRLHATSSFPNIYAAMTSQDPPASSRERTAKFISPTVLSINIWSSSKKYGFLPEQKYVYWVVYSK